MFRRVVVSVVVASVALAGLTGCAAATSSAKPTATASQSQKVADPMTVLTAAVKASQVALKDKGITETMKNPYGDGVFFDLPSYKGDVQAGWYDNVKKTSEAVFESESITPYFAETLLAGATDVKWLESGEISLVSEKVTYLFTVTDGVISRLVYESADGTFTADIVYEVSAENLARLDKINADLQNSSSNLDG